MRTRPRRPAPVQRSAFTGFRFPPDVIVLAVRWYLRFGLSYRDVEELLVERGVEVDHVTIYRWVQRFAPLLAHAALQPLAADRRSRGATITADPARGRRHTPGRPVGRRRPPRDRSRSPRLDHLLAPRRSRRRHRQAAQVSPAATRSRPRRGEMTSGTDPRWASALSPLNGPGNAPLAGHRRWAAPCRSGARAVGSAGTRPSRYAPRAPGRSPAMTARPRASGG
jgi:hypothetical protein